MIIPKPKSIIYTEEIFYLKDRINVKVSEEYGLNAINMLNIFVSEADITFINGTDGEIEFIFLKDQFNKKEAYNIKSANNKIIVEYGDKLGARNAAVSLYGLIEANETGYFIRGCKINDYPNAEYRGIMLDLGRKYIPIKDIKATILQMAIAKYNTLRLHLLEVEHNPLKSDAYPQLNKTKFQQYTKEQLKEIVAYAAILGFNVIPEIEMPSHGCFIIDQLPELKCKTKTVEPSRWAMCVGSEKTYEILENLIKELVDIFPCEYIHIGTDEIDFFDLKEEKYWPTWYDCEVCTDLSKRENIENKRELFYYFIRRIYSILTHFGKKMMMWNDGIDISVSPNLPRDILIQFWRVAGEGRGPVEGCSMQRFLEEGFHVVNSYFPETYLDEYIKEEKLLNWNPKKTPESTEDVKHFIIGGEMCTWGPNVHYDRTLPSAVFVFGDKLWDYSNRTITSEYRKTLTRSLLGVNTPGDFDVFESLGCCILPLDKEKMGNPDMVNINKLKLEENIKILNKLIYNNSLSAGVANEYIKCINWVIQEKYKTTNSFT